EQLGRNPPRAQFRRNRTPFRTVAMSPENGLYRPSEVLWWCLSFGANVFDQWFPERPALI
ncbi:hypothetical protein, partial [Bombella apis]|uniref:hypothetical protein n=1 Tax=Bombella apis TaxID=1785988 RepID=UPI0038D1658E